MNNDFLVSVLKMVDAIKQKNTDAINQEVAAINGMALSNEEVGYVKDYIRNSKEDYNILLDITSKLNCIVNKDTITDILLIANTNMSKEKITAILAKNYTFESDIEKGLFNSVLIRKIITVSDADLIKAAIDRLEK